MMQLTWWGLHACINFSAEQADALASFGNFDQDLQEIADTGGIAKKFDYGNDVVVLKLQGRADKDGKFKPTQKTYKRHKGGLRIVCHRESEPAESQSTCQTLTVLGILDDNVQKDKKLYNHYIFQHTTALNPNHKLICYTSGMPCDSGSDNNGSGTRRRARGNSSFFDRPVMKHLVM